jgi:hypothetical protein
MSFSNWEKQKEFEVKYIIPVAMLLCAVGAVAMLLPIVISFFK